MQVLEKTWKTLVLVPLFFTHSFTRADTVELMQPHVTPLPRELRTIDWSHWEKLQGLLGSFPSTVETRKSFVLAPPFDPWLAQFTALLRSPTSSPLCQDPVLRESWLAELPEEWRTVRQLFSWTLMACQRPVGGAQNVHFNFEARHWLLEAEDVIGQLEAPSLKTHARTEWVRWIASEDGFWRKTLELPDNYWEALLVTRAGVSGVDRDALAAWDLWITHGLPESFPGKSATERRRELLLYSPTPTLIALVKKYYPREFPVSLRGLSFEERLKHADALFQAGDIATSLSLALQLYKGTKEDLQHIAAARLAEQIYRARAQPEKRYEWQLLLQRLEAKSKTPDTSASEKTASKKTEKKSEKRPEKRIDLKFSENPEAFLTYVRTLWNANRTQRALELISAEDLPEREFDSQNPHWARLRFIRARLLMEINQWSEATRYLSTLREHKGELRAEIVWMLALTQLHQKLWPDAIETLTTAFEEEKDLRTRSAFLFWRARARQAIGDTEEAEDDLKRVLSENPVSFYAEASFQLLKLSSREWFQKDIAPETAQFLDHPFPALRFETQSWPIEQAAREELLFLLWNERQDLAHLWLHSFDKKTVPLEWNAAVGTHLQNVARLTESRGEKESLPPYFVRLYFPREYWNLITASAKRYQVDPYLILSLMRQESVFQDNATSVAKAMGLLQLLPATGQEVHRGLPASSPLKHQKYHPSKLHQPEWSVELGTAFVARLLKRFQGNWILTIAAYNAGPQAVKHWIRTRPMEDPLIFIELIPYLETRNYVRLVLRNYGHYKRLFDTVEPNTPIFNPLIPR